MVVVVITVAMVQLKQFKSIGNGKKRNRSRQTMVVVVITVAMVQLKQFKSYETSGKEIDLCTNNGGGGNYNDDGTIKTI